MADPVGSAGPKSAGDSGASGAPSGSDAPKYITAEELDEKLSGAFGKRLGEHSRSLTKQFTEMLAKGQEDLLGKIGTSLEEKFAALKPKEEPKPATPAGKDALAAVKLEELPEGQQHKAAFDAQQKELLRFKKQAEESEKKAQIERERSRSTALRTAAIEGLGKVGITPDRAEHALAFINSRGYLTYADDGKGDDIVFRAGESEVPLVDGLKAWGKTPDAKIYLPPQNPQGSGGGPGAPGNGASNPYTQIEQLLTEHVRGR